MIGQSSLRWLLSVGLGSGESLLWSASLLLLIGNPGSHFLQQWRGEIPEGKGREEAFCTSCRLRPKRMKTFSKGDLMSLKLWGQKDISHYAEELLA